MRQDANSSIMFSYVSNTILLSHLDYALNSLAIRKRTAESG